MKRLRITVYGRVQRVGYRDAVAELARILGIKGTVRNLDDDVSVEIVAEGEEGALNEFIKRINIKDYVVQVDKIDVKEEKPTGEFKHFKIIRGEPTEELGERLDVAGKVLYKIAEKQDQTLVTINKMLEKQDQTIVGINKMLEKQDKMLEKQDQTIDAINKMHEDMTTRFDIIEQKYGKISAILERISIALETLAGLKPK